MGMARDANRMIQILKLRRSSGIRKSRNRPEVTFDLEPRPRYTKSCSCRQNPDAIDQDFLFSELRAAPWNGRDTQEASAVIGAPGGLNEAPRRRRRDGCRSGRPPRPAAT